MYLRKTVRAGKYVIVFDKPTNATGKDADNDSAVESSGIAKAINAQKPMYRMEPKSCTSSATPGVRMVYKSRKKQQGKKGRIPNKQKSHVTRQFL